MRNCPHNEKNKEHKAFVADAEDICAIYWSSEGGLIFACKRGQKFCSS